jgi:hypothetical protein
MAQVPFTHPSPKGARSLPPARSPLRPAWVARQLRFKRVLRAIPLIFTA